MYLITLSFRYSSSLCNNCHGRIECCANNDQCLLGILFLLDLRFDTFEPILNSIFFRLTIQSSDVEFCILVDLLGCSARQSCLLSLSHSAKQTLMDQRAHCQKSPRLLQSSSSFSLSFRSPQGLVKFKRIKLCFFY